METIRIKYFEKDMEKIKQTKVGDWIDLRSRDDVFIQEDASGYIPLGVAMELPEGYEAIVAPRSSMFAKWGIVQTNSIGVIDETYKGDNDEWLLPVFCINGKTIRNCVKGTIINKGERLCQFRIIKHQPEINFVEVDMLGNNDRNGFGSTGVD